MCKGKMVCWHHLPICSFYCLLFLDPDGKFSRHFCCKCFNWSCSVITW
jgi:hypothetical protein